MLFSAYAVWTAYSHEAGSPSSGTQPCACASGRDARGSEGPFPVRLSCRLHLDCLLLTIRYCAFVKKKKRTDERVCWIQGEVALVTIKVCNPYAFPLFIEVVGIEADIEGGGSHNVPLEFNSTRGFEIQPCTNGSCSAHAIDLSVTPTAPGVLAIRVHLTQQNTICQHACHSSRLTHPTGCVDPLLQHRLPPPRRPPG